MNRLNVIDLFSGVGGLSLGAARAGFRIAGSVELDPIASASHEFNFPGTTHLTDDVATLTGRALLDLSLIHIWMCIRDRARRDTTAS